MNKTTIKRFVCLFLTIQMLFVCVLVPKAMIVEEVIEGTESSELIPMMASGYADDCYAIRGMTMDDVLVENGWTMVGNTIYENGNEIGRYDNGSNGQEPHFHLHSTPGCHYIVV